MTTDAALDPRVADQLQTLAIDAARPLIICDVDEVVVHFLRGLETHLEGQGYWLDAASFALNGNIRCRQSNRPASGEDVGKLLFGYFDDHVSAMELIDGAAEALAALSAFADIVMLTNLPPAYREARIANLAGHGLDYPLVANVGTKGPTVATMIEAHRERVVFVDDSPNNILSVAEHAPDVDLVHFMQDERFARVAPQVDDVLLRTDNWGEARRVIEEHLCTPPAADAGSVASGRTTA